MAASPSAQPDEPGEAYPAEIDLNDVTDSACLTKIALIEAMHSVCWAKGA